MRAAPLILLVAACHVTASDGDGVHNNLPDADGSGGGSDGMMQELGSDAAPDAVVLGDFGAPQLLTVAADPNKQEDDAAISNSGLKIVFAIVDGGAAGTKHLYWASRTSTTAAFGTATKTGFATDNSKNDENVRWSADDTTLYFASNRTPTLGGDDIYMVAHTVGANTWGTPAKIGAPISGSTTDKWLTTCTGGYYAMARADGQGNTHIYEGSGFGTASVTAPAMVAELTAPAGTELGTQLSADCLTVYFASSRDGTNDLWTATRATPTSAWNAPTKLTMFSTTQFNEQDPWMSPDLRTFIFASNAAGTNDEYFATR